MELPVFIKRSGDVYADACEISGNRKMTITTTVKDKAAIRPQPTAHAKPAVAKSVKDSISVLQEQPETMQDADDAQCPAPSQKATTTRPERAHTPEPPSVETTEDWSEMVEEAFAKSSFIARTPPQTRYTPPDVPMAPKKKETTPKTKARDPTTNATSTPTTLPNKNNEENNEDNPMPPPGNLIEALKKVKDILSQNVIRKDQKSDAQQTISQAIDHIMAMGSHEQKRKQPPNEDSARLINIENELAKLRKAITEPPQTYAQVAQRNTGKLATSAGN